MTNRIPGMVYCDASSSAFDTIPANRSPYWAPRRSSGVCIHYMDALVRKREYRGLYVPGGHSWPRQRGTIWPFSLL